MHCLKDESWSLIIYTRPFVCSPCLLFQFTVLSILPNTYRTLSIPLFFIIRIPRIGYGLYQFMEFEADALLHFWEGIFKSFVPPQLARSSKEILKLPWPKGFPTSNGISESFKASSPSNISPSCWCMLIWASFIFSKTMISLFSFIKIKQNEFFLNLYSYF